MLNLELMTEQEIIALLHDDQQLEEIINGNVRCLEQGEEITLELSHLFARISPNNQNNNALVDISKISKLIATHAKKYLKNTTKKSDEENEIIFKSVYYPIINLINNLSIDRAKELVSTKAIQEIIVNPRIAIMLTYNFLASVAKPSVLNVFESSLKTKILKTKLSKLDITRTKKALRQTINQYKEDEATRRHFEADYQSIKDKEKYLQNLANYYISVKGMTEHRLTFLITHREEKRTEKFKQQNIELYEHNTQLLNDALSSPQSSSRR